MLVTFTNEVTTRDIKLFKAIGKRHIYRSVMWLMWCERSCGLIRNSKVLNLELSSHASFLLRTGSNILSFHFSIKQPMNYVYELSSSKYTYCNTIVFIIIMTLRNHVGQISSLKLHGRLTNVQKLVAKHKNPWRPELQHAKVKISLWNITHTSVSVTNCVSYLGVQFVHYEMTQRSLEEILFGVVLQQRIVHGAHSNLEHTQVQINTRTLTFINCYIY